jgi:nitrite reductase (NADH) small subunit
MTAVAEPARTWVEVCELARIPKSDGVAALLPDGRQAAVFHTDDGEVLAIGNVDPISGAAVLSRGIVGDAGGVPVVASPIYKERFDLRTGECLDAEARVPVFPASIAR